MTLRHRLAGIAVLASATLVSIGTPASGQTGSEEPSPDVPDQVAPGEEIIHSWALAPAESEQEGGGGDRPILSYVANPGDVIDDAVSLYNLGNVPLTFRVYATDAFNNDAGEFSLLSGNETPTDVGAWVDIAPGADQLTVLPGNHATIPITINVPADASPGDHVGAVLAASTALSPDDAGQIIAVDRRTGTRIYLRVNGAIRPELAIEDLSAEYSPSANPLDGSMSVSYRIENRGNIRLGGTHALSIAGPLGLGRQRIQGEELPELLPGQGIDITTAVDGVPALLFSSTEVVVEPDASASGVRLAPTKASTTTLTPPIAMLLIALAVVLTLLLARALRRHRTGRVSEWELVDNGPDLETASESDREHQPT